MMTVCISRCRSGCGRVHRLSEAEPFPLTPVVVSSSSQIIVVMPRCSSVTESYWNGALANVSCIRPVLDVTLPWRRSSVQVRFMDNFLHVREMCQFS